MTDHSLSFAHTSVPKIAIIGGGLTGLFTATLLERSFSQGDDKSLLPEITIFEKSRSVGRLATRYRTDEQTGKHWQWSFGAQFFTVKTDPFKQFITPWLDSHLLQPWLAQVVHLTVANKDAQTPQIEPKEQWDTQHARYISTPKMTSWGRALADEFQHTRIAFKTRVAPLHKAHFVEENNANSKTELFDEEGNSLGGFDWVICTAPNGQALELMADSGFARQADITKPTMQACYTLMLGWDEVSQLPATLTNQASARWDVAYVKHSPLDRIFIEHQKPAHSALLPSVTIHARNDWSETHVDEDMETIKAQLLTAAKQALNWNAQTAPTQIDCHRWRYAATIVDDNKSLDILIDQRRQWIVSGDWCGQGNIESCYQVATQTVARICAQSLMSAD